MSSEAPTCATSGYALAYWSQANRIQKYDLWAGYSSVKFFGLFMAVAQELLGWLLMRVKQARIEELVTE